MLYDTVIFDSAGRLGVDEELMKQARDIRAAVQPNEILFVIDAMIGQDAVKTAKAFDEGVDFTGVVLSKLDGDARGGAALSVASVTGKPILFASTGEGLKDFEVFHPDRMASRILDMGDILTLIEQAQKQFDEEEARKAAVMAQALDAAGAAPLALMEALCQASDLHREYAQKGTAIAISDVGVGVACCKAALQGASLNVFINTKSMADRAKAEAVIEMARAMLDASCALADGIFADVAARFQ